MTLTDEEIGTAIFMNAVAASLLQFDQYPDEPWTSCVFYNYISYVLVQYRALCEVSDSQLDYAWSLCGVLANGLDIVRGRQLLTLLDPPDFYPDT